MDEFLGYKHIAFNSGTILNDSRSRYHNELALS